MTTPYERLLMATAHQDQIRSRPVRLSEMISVRSSDLRAILVDHAAYRAGLEKIFFAADSMLANLNALTPPTGV